MVGVVRTALGLRPCGRRGAHGVGISAFQKQDHPPAPPFPYPAQSFAPLPRPLLANQRCEVADARVQVQSLRVFLGTPRAAGDPGQRRQPLGPPGQPGWGWGGGLGHPGWTPCCPPPIGCVRGALPPGEAWRSCWDKKAQRASSVIAFSFSSFLLFLLLCLFIFHLDAHNLRAVVRSY